jgi:phosphoglycolate phosphatase-like HAD superfamily hydrolase
MSLLITDLDNTLYDWVTYYALAFRALVDVLVEDLEVDREELLDEFKAVHQRHGDSEYPFAIFELPSVKRRFPHLKGDELRAALGRAFRAFEATREEHLRLYPAVASTLAALRQAGVQIVAHTEAMAENAYFRLRHLSISARFSALYALEGRLTGRDHLSPAAVAALTEGFIQLVPRTERKPNPRLILDICSREGVRKEDAWYVGDSLTRDVSMAKTAGVKAVWARYGTWYDRGLWDSLVRITHWTDEDVARETELRRELSSVQPDWTIDSFAELTGLLSVTGDRR